MTSPRPSSPPSAPARTLRARARTRRGATFATFALLLLAAAPAPRGVPGMVSAADPRAAAAGVEILRAGGTAADAAIATMLALTVVEPQSSGIGGGSYLLDRDARSGRLDTYDGRETAPHAATDHYFYEGGQPLSHADAVPGGKSVGVPGDLRMWATVHQQHGKLPWAALFRPAIRLAQGGFLITPRLETELLEDGGHLDAWSRAHYFGADGKPLPVGTRLTNPELAQTLSDIARRGAESFYHGPIAQGIAATVQSASRNPSPLTAADIASYQPRERAPVCGSYRGYRICGMGPSSSGGFLVIAILKQLERFDLAKLGPDSPVAWHLVAESMRLAYADRDMYVGDPDYVSVPMAGLLDPAYLAGRSALISPDQSMASVQPGQPAGAPARLHVPDHEVAGTTHLVVADRAGDVVSVTSTVEGPFGSGLTYRGFVLNNELTDFDIVPEKGGYLVANRVQGGKRPRSSMAPTIVTGPDGRVRIAIGAAGGATIPAQVAKALIGVLDWHLSAQAAIALPQLFAPGDTVVVERGTRLEAMVPALEALGHHVVVAGLPLKANAIERLPDGRWRGAADPRSEGVAIGE